jgi:hypothetical protein
MIQVASAVLADDASDEREQGRQRDDGHEGYIESIH